jgi:ribosome-binding factor A
MPDLKRTDRIADEMQKQLTLLLAKDVRDPRLPKLITITAVKVTQDLSNATVYFTAFAAKSISDAEHTLNHIAPYLRSLLGKAMLLRRLPELHFKYDTSIEYANNLTKLINSLDK